MPITGLRWGVDSGNDLHILRNGVPSLPLDDQAFVVDEELVMIGTHQVQKTEYISIRDVLANPAPHPEITAMGFQPSWAQSG